MTEKTPAEIEKILEEIREELEKGITRNKVLPLDWAMDRITPIIKKALSEKEKETSEICENCQKYEQCEFESENGMNEVSCKKFKPKSVGGNENYSDKKDKEMSEKYLEDLYKEGEGK